MCFIHVIQRIPWESDQDFLHTCSTQQGSLSCRRYCKHWRSIGFVWVLGGAWVEQTHLNGTWWLSCAWLNPQLFFGYVRLFWCLPTSSEALRSVHLSIWKRSYCHCYVNITLVHLWIFVFFRLPGAPQHNPLLLCILLFSRSIHTWIVSKLCIVAPAVKSFPNNYRVLLIESLQHPAQQWMREREYTGAITAICTWVFEPEKWEWEQLVIRIRWCECNTVM